MSAMADSNAGASTSAAAAHEDSQPVEIPPSVYDVASWERKHLPQLPYDVLDSTVFRWTLKDYSWERLEKRRQKLYSEPFKCGGHTWKLMLFLGGVVANDPGKVSIYLVCTSTAKNEHPCCQMAFAMSNPNDPTVYLTYNSYHRFTPHDDDWGFTYFCSSDRLRTESSSGRPIPVLEDDHVVISVFVKVVKDSTGGGVLWYNLGTGYCPRATTGLMNLHSPSLGVACLNLALQLLYMIAPFRKAVYSIPTSKDDKRTAVPYALQRLFYELQTSPNSVGQIDLITAMGWSDAFLRRSRFDVMDYIRPILAALEEHLPAQEKHVVRQLFYGRSEAYLSCLDVPYNSTFGEAFDALDLDVHGFPDIRRSLRDYKEPRPLLGESRITTPGSGLQDAALGVRLRSLPQVLVCNLRRWRWDAGAKSQVKCEDRYEYPLELNMRDVVHPMGNPDMPAQYDYSLHGVLVNDGDIDGGSYHALMKPRLDTFWCKFDEQTIIPVEDSSVKEPFEGANSAYALVYLRKDMLSELLATVEEDVVPQHIRELKAEWATDLEDNAPMQIRLIGKYQFKHFQGFDIAHPNTAVMFDARRDETLRDILPRIRKLFKRVVQLRAMVKRHNRAVRPAKIVPITGSTLDMTLREIGTTYNNYLEDSYLFFYVEESADLKREKPFDKNKRLIFLKHFDIPGESLLGVGAVYVSPNDKVAVIRNRICKIMRWRASFDIDMLEEVMCEVSQSLQTDLTFKQSNIETGDVICFNRKYVPPPDPEAGSSSEEPQERPPLPKYTNLQAIMRAFERPAP
ncbi:cysteine proteinase [Exidia glandulosa HHB12029]|uniref:Cysteine proteinase n=1 Tax=Exidia glandulosa HHB12029 TaxID=1314781 RepID=A0A165Q7H3_EXIGL|nr:cysteine proteinase [Exidia glandulosa HHB12029]